MRRKTLSLLLAFCMLLALFPTTVSAEPSTGTVNLELAGNGRIEKISGDQADIVWSGASGTQTLELETINGQDNLMNAHYNIIADPGYRIKSVSLYSVGADTVVFDLNTTSGGGGFFGRVLDGGNHLIAGSVRWFAENGDRLVAEFESTSASRETVAAEGEMGLSLAQTLPGVTKVEIKDTFTITHEMAITRETEIKNGTVTVDAAAALDINGCSFGPDFDKDTTNPSRLVNHGIIAVNAGGTLFLIDENYGGIIVKSGGIMETGVENTSAASITVKSGGEARCAMSKNIENAGQFTVDAGGILKPQKGAGFVNHIGDDAGTLTLNGDVVFNEGYWSDFSEGALQGNGRLVINYRIQPDDLSNLQSAVQAANTGGGASLQIINESVVELDGSADFSAFKAAISSAPIRAVYITNASITINEDLNITDKTIYLEGGAALTLNAGKTLTLTDTSGTGFQCGVTNSIDTGENSVRPSTSVTINGRLVLANGASFGGYIGTVTIGSGGSIDNSDGSIDVRYTLYCNGTITNISYADRGSTGRLRVFTNGFVIKDGVAILGEQAGSVASAQADAAVLAMSVSQATELLENTIYDDHPNPVNMTLTKDLTLPAGTLLWVPDLAAYGNYVNIGDTDQGTGAASLTVGGGRTLTIENGATLRLNGAFTNNGTAFYNGSVAGDGPVGGAGLFVLAPDTTIKIAAGGGTIRGANDDSTVATESGKGYTVGSDGKLITSHSIYAADNQLDLIVGAGIEGLLQNGAALAPPVGLAQAAVATAGLNTSDNYAAKLEAELKSITQNNGVTLVYDIKPKISVNEGDWTDITALEGDSANNTPITFRLPVPADTAESYVRIVHKNGDTVKSIDFYPVLTDVAENKYAEIVTKSFSTFEMSFSASSGDGEEEESRNNGGGSGGGTVSLSSAAPVTKGNLTMVTSEIKPVLTGTSALAAVTEATMSGAIEAATEAAARRNTSANINLVVDAPEEATAVKASIPTASVGKLAEADVSASLTVTTPVGSVTFDGEALKNIGRTAAGTDVTISVAKVSKEELTPEQQALAGDRPVIDLSVISNGRLISDFGSGSAAVSIPYTLAEGEDAEGIMVWYLADDGTLTPVECNYLDGRLNFKTGHFSQYVLAYFPFKDLKGEEWYYGNVAYAYTNDLMNGVDSNRFDPSGTTAKGMIVAILWRLEGSPVSATHSFADVAADMWYADAVGWAAANGIVEGYGGKFNPEAPVTREQMAAILHRYAAYRGYGESSLASPGSITNTGGPRDTAGPGVLTAFADKGEISPWAEEAMAWTVRNGILSGEGNGKLDPVGITQRAQTAAIFQRLIENFTVPVY